MASSVMKIVLVGAGGVGKTATAYRLANGAFQETAMTIGLDITTWTISDLDSSGQIKIAAFDLGGQKQFRSFQDAFIIGAECVLILIDMSRFTTVAAVDEWMHIVQHIPREKWLLVGNKADVASITEEDVKIKAQELGVPYVIVSAKTGLNFDRLSQEITRIVTCE